MANVELYVTKKGITTYKVKWRDNELRKPDGERAPQTVTVYTSDDADDLKRLVDRADQRWPTREELAKFGLTWILTDGEPIDETPYTVTRLCKDFLEYLGNPDSLRPPSADSLAHYERFCRLHVETHDFGNVLAATATRADARQ